MRTVVLMLHLTRRRHTMFRPLLPRQPPILLVIIVIPPPLRLNQPLPLLPLPPLRIYLKLAPITLIAMAAAVVMVLVPRRIKIVRILME